MDKRHSTRILHLVFMLASLIGAPSAALAFITSEEQQWEADIYEAKSRARDFQDHLRREKQAEVERESEAQDYAVERVEEAGRYEDLRKGYIIERDARPDEQAEYERLEKAYEAEIEEEEKRMEGHRREYIVNRTRVHDVISREAFIDEMLELGLEKSPEITW